MCLCLEPLEIGQKIINAANKYTMYLLVIKQFYICFILLKYLPGLVFRPSLYTRSGIEHIFDQGS